MRTAVQMVPMQRHVKSYDVLLVYQGQPMAVVEDRCQGVTTLSLS